MKTLGLRYPFSRALGILHFFSLHHAKSRSLKLLLFFFIAADSTLAAWHGEVATRASCNNGVSARVQTPTSFFSLLCPNFIRRGGINLHLFFSLFWFGLLGASLLPQIVLGSGSFSQGRNASSKLPHDPSLQRVDSFVDVSATENVSICWSLAAMHCVLGFRFGTLGSCSCVLN